MARNRKRIRFKRRWSSGASPPMPPVMRIAHRGASGKGLAPENTLAAVQKALEIGVDLVEVDVQLTADGHPVVIHDRTVDRTTNGTGPVDTLTLNQVRRLDAGNWYDSVFKGERVPRLEDVLDLAGKRALVLIETKTEEASERVVTTVRSLRAQSRVVIQSFLGSALRTVSRLDRRIPTAFLMSAGKAVLRRKTGVVKRVLRLGANALALDHTSVRPELVAMFLTRAMGFWVWTVDREDEMREMVELGVGGIITNYPDRLKQVLSRET